MANSEDPDEVAHYEPPHLNLRCLQIQLFFIFGALRAKDKMEFLQRLKIFI